ncbi:MAG: UDP-N-acetylglucosamine 4,6-dehydratase (inverting), partial [Oligoflexales bacterium]|nr:UDP-N-acetylglucosamine 4,6-dehydratase (inverting) [Oligoflexales bacterium]
KCVKDSNVRFFLGDIGDKERLWRACDKVDYIVHAAALKIVPTAEYNPFEYIKTNVIGAMNIIDVAIDRGVEKVIALSTDKACNPINLYGATKLCSDKLFIAGNSYTSINKTVFAIVRYGNVMGSRGSVIPFFREQARDGLITITDEKMTRFWITLEMAVDFVNKVFTEAVRGEIFVPKIPSMKIVDLADAIAPNVERKVTGIRPGEKLHEVLITEDDARFTYDFGDHYRIFPAISGHYELKSNKNVHVRKVPENFVYSSDNNSNWLTVEEMKKMISSSM